MRAEHLGDPQRQVGRGDPFGQRPVQIDADDFRHEKRHRLPEHPRLGLDPAHAPADDAEAVDHRGVRIGAHEGIRIVGSTFRKDALREEFEVHLVDDPDPRRHHGERVERLLAPFEEFVAFPVPDEFDRHVLVERGLRAGKIHLHRVVDDEIHRHQRLHHFRISTLGHGGITHRGHIHQQRNTGEILQNDPGDSERDLVIAGRLRIPAGEIRNIVFGDLFPIAVAQDGFEDDPDRNREPVQARGAAAIAKGRQ